MSKKAQQNWEDAYTDKLVTYVADPRNPIDLEQMWNYKVIHKHIVNHLPNIKNPKIIEVGCGGARNALYLALHGVDVTCVDYSPEALRLARANFDAFNAKGSFLLDDLLDSNIPDNTFDCVMSFGLLEHFSDLKPIIDSLTRIIKPGGIHIHLVIPKKFSTQTIMNILMFPIKLVNNLIIRRQPLRGILRRSYRNFPHYENTFLWYEYCGAFEKSRNEVLKCEPGGLILPFIFWTQFVGLGYTIVKLFQSPINKINEWVRKSTSPIIYRLSPTFTIISRKH
jgi:ubiquinone/menaquinone biosynthesis C-methylase UbiE